MVEVTTEFLSDIIIVYVSGECSVRTIGKVEIAWNMALARNPKVIALDFKNLDQVDSITIGSLVRLFHSAGKKNIELVLYNLCDPILELFKRAALDTFLKIVTKKTFEAEYLNTGSMNKAVGI
ncbi:MAG: STAS domain-containing protein [bacterium]|nr:STAS domain-containing protein [bacterium]